MKKQVKRLNLKKSTITLLGRNKEMRVQGGKEAATQPVVSCYVACQPSIKNPCIPPTEIGCTTAV